MKKYEEEGNLVSQLMQAYSLRAHLKITSQNITENQRFICYRSNA